MQRKKSVLYTVALLVSAGLFAQSWWARDRVQPSFASMPSEAALFGSQPMPSSAPTQARNEAGTTPTSTGLADPAPVAVPATQSAQTQSPPSTVQAGLEPPQQDWLLELDSWSQRALELAPRPGSHSLEELALLLEGRNLTTPGARDSSAPEVPLPEVVAATPIKTGHSALVASTLLSASAEDRQTLLGLAEREPLQGVLHLGASKSVLIGGRTRQVGDALGTSGAHIEEIHARSVVLSKGRARLEIELGAPSRTPIAPARTPGQPQSTEGMNELPPMPEIVVGASPASQPQP